MARERDKKGRFLGPVPKKKKRSQGIESKPSYEVDHDYFTEHVCDGESKCTDKDCSKSRSIDLGKNVDPVGWQEGRRIVEFSVLLSSLKSCKFCRLGPVPLTFDNVVGELKKGLSGFLYVKCVNPECGKVNIAPYGKTHRVKKKGMPCFVANTKLGTCEYIRFLNYPFIVNSK
jgi:hypothetical protein